MIGLIIWLYTVFWRLSMAQAVTVNSLRRTHLAHKSQKVLACPMMTRLEAIMVKVKRAEEHIRDLQTEIESFRDGPPKPYIIQTENDPQTGELLYKATYVRDVPIRFAAIAGDVLQNLRSALDHLAWQLVEAAGNTPRRGVT